MSAPEAKSNGIISQLNQPTIGHCSMRGHECRLAIWSAL